MNYLNLLPRELQFLIAEFVPSKPDHPYPYIDEYKNIVLDWYNKTLVFDSAVYRNYHELYTKGISETDIPYLKGGFNQYVTDFCYYNMFIDYHTGQFEKIPIRKRRIERNYQRLPKMRVA